MTPLALDIAIGLIIALSTVVAYLRGIIKEIFAIAGLFVALFFAWEGGHILIPTFNQWLGVPDGVDTAKDHLVLGLLTPSVASKVFAYGGTFFFFLVIMMMLGHLINKWVAEAGLGIVDRLAGGFFGFLRGFLLIFILYVPCVYLIDQTKFPEWAKQSVSVPFLQKTLDWVNVRFELNKMIEDRGNGIAIKFDKVDLSKIGESLHPAEEELKEKLNAEEKEIQKAPDTQPEQLMQKMEAPPAGEPPAPAP